MTAIGSHSKQAGQAPGQRGSSGERRRAIASAARALIAQKGFEGLRTRDIADRVGINIATLHYHVPSKQDLIELVAESLRLEFIANRKRWWREGLSAEDELRLELAEHVATASERPETLVVLSELTNRARHDPAIEAVLGPMRLYWRGQIRGILARGIAEGAFRTDLDPEAAAHIVTATLSAIGDCADKGKPATAFSAITDEILRSVRAR